METKKLTKETDSLILNITNNMHRNAYELIEKDLLVASNQIRSYVQSNNSENQMSVESRIQRVNESITNCLEKMLGFGPSLGDTYIAESDLYNAITFEVEEFSEQKYSDIDLRMTHLSTRLNDFAEYVRENKDLNLELSDCELTFK